MKQVRYSTVHSLITFYEIHYQILCVYFSSQLGDIQFVSRVVDLTSNPSLLDASALTVCGNLLFSRTINATQDSQVSSVRGN